MKSKFKNMDKLLFLLMIIYTVLGLVMVFSASSMTAVLQYGKSESYFFTRQLFFVILAYICGFIILFMPNKFIRLFKKTSNLLGIISIILLFITWTSGIHANGATSWLKIGPIRLQPSEFVKTFMICSIAFAFNNPKKAFYKYRFLLPFSYVVIYLALIFAQPDLGTDMIVAIIAFLMFMALPIRNGNQKKLKIVAGTIAVCVVCMFAMGSDILKGALTEEQLSRFVYKNPCARYSEKTGYQVCNGYIAINNGGLFGVGLGNSTQKYLYLPEAYTDFIFPIIVEELGSITAGIIIIGFIIMLYRILRIAKSSETLTGSLLAYGTFSLITAHLLVNLLGVMAVIPLTGVPLPFLSSGGSFVFNLIVLLFITLRVSIENKNIRLKKEINNL